MEDYGDLWDDYAGKFDLKLVNLNGDWSKLDEEEQEIAALWKLFVDVNGGGFIEFFCNWGFDCFCYAMRGLKRINDTGLYELLTGVYKDVLGKFENDTRLAEYWDIMEYLTEENIERLEDVDTQFYETECDFFVKMAYEYYHEILKKTVTLVEN